MLKPVSTQNTGRSSSRAKSGYSNANSRPRNSSAKSNHTKKYIIRAMSSRTNSRTHGERPVYSKMSTKDALAIKHE